ncbi:MAG: class IV adenylate cyclase [Theionarchaea archaeon]|nr:class IV adenylate cyclase [Theionarchaea archaeon]
MSREIEIKLEYDDREEVISRLEEMKAEKKEVIELKDTYYSSQKDMKNIHDLLRIRKKNGDVELTYKGKCLDKNNVWERVELSVRVDNSETMEKILLNMGLHKISENMSRREIWKYETSEIMFIDFIYPEELRLVEVESDSYESVRSILDRLSDVVTEVGEDLFRKFDDSKNKKRSKKI